MAQVRVRGFILASVRQADVIGPPGLAGNSVSSDLYVAPPLGRTMLRTPRLVAVAPSSRSVMRLRQEVEAMTGAEAACLAITRERRGTRARPRERRRPGVRFRLSGWHAAAVALWTRGPYPLTPTPDGYAVVNLRPPYPRTWELVGDQVVTAARNHAREWNEFAGTLEALMAVGWSLRGEASLYATRHSAVSDVSALIDADLKPGMLVEWCVADRYGGLFAIGGIAAGHEPPPGTFPGSTLPALIVNDLTGAQQLVQSEDELRAAMGDELRGCASWWREHPEERSDHAAHALPDELDELANSLESEPVPATVADAVASPLGVFRGAPSTRVQVYPVSAVIFAGVMEAARDFSALGTAPREGLAAQLRTRGAAVAGELGLAEPAA